MTARPGPPGSLLDLDASRTPITPLDAATLVLLRDDPGGPQVFCVERNRNSRFMGGALVFPGGKIDAADRDPAWRPLLQDAHPRLHWLAEDDELRRALAVAACRESLEEAAILPVTGALSHDDAVTMRQTLTRGSQELRDALAARGLSIDLGSLVPFARWVTPAAEARRFDTRFFMLRTPAGQDGAHDDHETMASFWATPQDILGRWEAREVQLAPPTHRTLQWLSAYATVDAALGAAEHVRLDPICPALIDYDGTIALTLPGDRDHPQADPIIDGASRYVLREEQWRPEDRK
jgi:8-oxo-dGTP pyrophosphatase MutT (NUDIX family)